MKLLIKVTKEILRQSADCTTMNSMRNCAIALAIRGIWPQATVSQTHIVPFRYDAGINARRMEIRLPAPVSIFVQTFDRLPPCLRMGMNEIEFEIDVPDDIIEMTDISDIQTYLAEHPLTYPLNQQPCV